MNLRKIILLSAAAVALSSGQNLYAHSGGTDSSGCHTNHSNGSYHCHNPKDFNDEEKSKARAPASVESEDIKLSDENIPMNIKDNSKTIINN